jgi:hypothetical protein
VDLIVVDTGALHALPSSALGRAWVVAVASDADAACRATAEASVDALWPARPTRAEIEVTIERARRHRRPMGADDVAALDEVLHRQGLLVERLGRALEAEQAALARVPPPLDAVEHDAPLHLARVEEVRVVARHLARRALAAGEDLFVVVDEAEAIPLRPCDVHHRVGAVRLCLVCDPSPDQRAVLRAANASPLTAGASVDDELDRRFGDAYARPISRRSDP